MKPLRRKKLYEVTQNPITGQDRIWDLTQEADILSDEGSVDSAGLHRKYFGDCGCDGPIGGCCYECQAISCKSCHGRCHNCQKPICLEHSSFLEIEGQNKIRLCNHCFEAITRKRKWAKAGNLLLSLFIEKNHE